MADEKPKLSLAGVLHHVIDRLAPHPDTAQNLHRVIDENLTSPQELEERNRNPWADKPDQEVVEAAIAGDQGAAAEYRARKERQAAAAAPPAAGSEA